MKNKLLVNESQLKNIIRESVRRVISELDWRTLASAQAKAGKEAVNVNTPPGLATKRAEQARKFSNGLSNTIKKQYGLNDDEISAATSDRGNRDAYSKASRKSLKNMDKLRKDWDHYANGKLDSEKDYRNGKWGA